MKKNYQKPTMTVVKLQQQTPLLVGSELRMGSTLGNGWTGSGGDAWSGSGSSGGSGSSLGGGWTDTGGSAWD